MDLKCLKYPHLWGKKLLVNGQEVEFDGTGVARSVSDEVGQTLLRSGAYSDVTPQHTAPPAGGKRNKATAAGS